MVLTPFLDVYWVGIAQYIMSPPPNSRQAVLIKVLSSIIYMNKDLAAITAIWRALFGVRNRRFCCLFVYLSSFCQRAAEDVLRQIMGPSLETDAIFDAVLSVNYCAIVVACL